jgi:crotonobetainyl-CoA:carnitine CoA-transferase CaiB-like acyl-CoA transferase
MAGERSTLPAYDYLLQGMAGWMHLTGEPDGPPVRTGPSLVDYCGGLVAALAAIVGVHAARRDGHGMDCDLSLFDVALSMLTYPATWWLNDGYEVRRCALSAHPSLVPFQNFATADGWIVVACPKEKFWTRLAVALRRPELADDVRFSTFAARAEHAEVLKGILGECFRTRTTAYWVARLSEAGVPAAPVRSVPEALADPAVSERGMVVDVVGRDGVTVRLPTTAIRVGGAVPATSAAPDRGADTRAVMIELLGYGDERIAACAAAGAFGSLGDCSRACSN